MTNEEIAWFTGIFDGEGSIVNEGPNSVHLKVDMADLDIIERLFKLAECGSIIERKPRKEIHSTTYLWRVCSALDVQRLLLLMIPWFGERRKQRALDALKRLENNRTIQKGIPFRISQR